MNESEDKRMQLLIPFLVVSIFSAIIITGFVGIDLKKEESERYLENCIKSDQCIEQVKTMRNDSFNCYLDIECREFIRGNK